MIPIVPLSESDSVIEMSGERPLTKSHERFIQLPA